MSITPKTAKKLAKGLRGALTEAGVNIPHGQALDVISKLEGNRDWNVFLGKKEQGEDGSVRELAKLLQKSLSDLAVSYSESHAMHCTEEDGCATCEYIEEVAADLDHAKSVLGSTPEAMMLPYWYVAQAIHHGHNDFIYLGEHTSEEAARNHLMSGGYDTSLESLYTETGSFVNVDPVETGLVKEVFKVVAYKYAAKKELNEQHDKIIMDHVSEDMGRMVAENYEHLYGYFELRSHQTNKVVVINNCMNLAYFKTAEDYREGHHWNLEDGYFFRSADVREHVERELEDEYEVIELQDKDGNMIEVFSRDGVDL